MKPSGYIKHVLILFLLVPLLSACSLSSHGKEDSRSGLYFDTVVTVTVYADSATDTGALLDECMNICSKYMRLFDKNTPGSDIALINLAGTSPTKVEEDTSVMIKKALTYSELTDGAFDITVEPLSHLWNFHSDDPIIPSDEKITSAIRHIGYKNVKISDDMITFDKPGCSMDPGGAAKGYVADRIAEYLNAKKITGAIINMGGDMRLIGQKSDGGIFNIGINDPFGKGSCICSLSLTDKSVATSGTYERCFTKDGKTYHHILDTKTGYPADTDIVSATVITNDTEAADCLATACILLGSAKALPLIESLDDTEAVMILSDGTITQTSGAAAFIRTQ